MSVHIERATQSSALVAASALFDHPARSDAVTRFLAEPGHHLLLAYDDAATPVGMVSGVETTHPDKGTEMFLYELAVDAGSQGRGVGTALVRALAALAQEKGCYGMWVLTDADNLPAMGAYRSAGGGDPTLTTMLTWTFDAVDQGVDAGPPDQL
jgi:ribosomal protein S18 acetylase RimI-like enzyme